MNKKLILEIGTKFSKWEIISCDTIKKNNLTNWSCRCECGLETYVPLNNLMNGSSTQCSDCASKESGMKRRKGCGDISGEMWSIIKSNVDKRNISFNLRIEEAWDRFEYQNRKCALSNDDITLSGYPYSKEKTSAVLTLINQNKSYNKTNIIWIHSDVAEMKSTMSLDKFLEIAYKVTLNSGKEKIN